MKYALTKVCFALCLSFFLLACSTTTYVNSNLQEGQRLFQTGYYKRSLHQLLPLACDGNPQAQYAVGYMYYYGYGVAQDLEVGYFWMKRAAGQNYQPAIQALNMIKADKSKKRINYQAFI